jgi:3-isopropylmalate/(R)-2-methylmalate dehydratase large subunit
MQILLHGATKPGVCARDVTQFVVGHVGEDGAIYKAMEFAGSYIESLPVEDRLLFPLQSIDMGGKCGFVNPDEKTAAYAKAVLGDRTFDFFPNDAGTRYQEVIEIDVSKLEPQVACPPTVGNVKPVGEVTGVPINIAEVGGSTGGRLEDIRQLAECFRNRKVHPGVRLQVVAASRGIYSAALREGLFQVLHDAGANIFPPSCGSNQMYNMGGMAEDEVMVSTQARNFPGRNGHPKARHYLASTLTVAASAVKGRIADPREVL